MPELNKQESWEEEFDKLVDSVSQSTDFDNAVYKETREYIKSFIRSQRQLARKELLEELEKRIGMMRQWINEDRITDPSKSITNQQIKKWLFD